MLSGGNEVAMQKLKWETKEWRNMYVELLQSRTSMVHNIKIMICCMAIGHAWIIL